MQKTFTSNDLRPKHIKEQANILRPRLFISAQNGLWLSDFLVPRLIVLSAKALLANRVWHLDWRCDLLTSITLPLLQSSVNCLGALCSDWPKYVSLRSNFLFSNNNFNFFPPIFLGGRSSALVVICHLSKSSPILISLLSNSTFYVSAHTSHLWKWLNFPLTSFRGFFLKGKWAWINLIIYDFYQISQHMCHLGTIVRLYSNNNHVTAFCDLPLMILRERWHKSWTQSEVVWFIIFHRTVFNTSLKPWRLPWPFPCSWGWKRSTWCQWLGKEKSIYNSNGKFHSCKVKLWLCAVITRSALYTVVNVTRTLSSSINPVLNGGILHIKK